MPEEKTSAVIDAIRARVRQNQFRLSKHATRRLDLRGRTLADITQVISSGEVIREYPNEKPYPEYLFLGYLRGGEDPCYVVVASNDETIIVTVHDYDPEVYEPDYRTRRKTQ
jgi:hypothetical protein